MRLLPLMRFVDADASGFPRQWASMTLTAAQCVIAGSRGERTCRFHY